MKNNDNTHEPAVLFLDELTASSLVSTPLVRSSLLGEAPMKKITFNHPNNDHVQRLVDGLDIVDRLHNLGYDIDHEDAVLSWNAHSKISGPDWLSLPDDDQDLLAAVLKHCI
jgi:hypothetical protein